MSYGGANKGGDKKRGGNRGQDNDEEDYQDDYDGGKNGKKKREISYRPREGDEEDDGNQEYERSSRTKNARNAAGDDEAQETEEMR